MLRQIQANLTAQQIAISEGSHADYLELDMEYHAVYVLAVCSVSMTSYVVAMISSVTEETATPTPSVTTQVFCPFLPCVEQVSMHLQQIGSLDKRVAIGLVCRQHQQNPERSKRLLLCNSLLRFSCEGKRRSKAETVKGAMSLSARMTARLSESVFACSFLQIPI